MSSKPINFYFNYTAIASEPCWWIVNYFNGLSGDEVRRMLFEAASVYWRSLAYYEKTGDLEEAQYQREISIYRLNTQIEYLISDLGLSYQIVHEGNPPLPFKLTPPSANPVNINCRYRVSDTLPEAVLIKYLLDDKTQITPVQKVLWPCVAFYGTLAVESENVNSSHARLPDESLLKMGYYCCHLLKSHCHFLRSLWGNPASSPTPVITSLVNPEANGVAASLNGNALNTTTPQDEWFDDLFN